MKKATVIGLLCLVFLQFLQTASSKGRVIIGPVVFDLLIFLHTDLVDLNQV